MKNIIAVFASLAVILLILTVACTAADRYCHYRWKEDRRRERQAIARRRKTMQNRLPDLTVRRDSTEHREEVAS